MQLQLLNPAIAPRLLKARDTPLDRDFQPGHYDVICQRGKKAYRHVGNRRFRLMIENHVERYATSKKKVDKSLLVISIVDTIRKLSPDGGFVRFCKNNNCYVEIGDHLAREKVGHALREIMNGNGEGNVKQKALEVIKSAGGSNSITSAFAAVAAPQQHIKKPTLLNDFVTDVLLLSSAATRSCCADEEPLPLELHVASYQGSTTSTNRTSTTLPLPLMDGFTRDLFLLERRHHAGGDSTSTALTNQLREPSSLKEMQLTSLSTTMMMRVGGTGEDAGVGTRAAAPPPLAARRRSPTEERESLHHDLKTFNLFQQI